MLTDGRTMDAGDIGSLNLAHLGAFDSGELKATTKIYMQIRHTETDTLKLRELAGITSNIEIFLILCIQFVLCMDCQFMK